MVLGVTRIQEGLGDAGEEGGSKSTFLWRREVRLPCPSRRAELRLLWHLLLAQWSTEGRSPAEVKRKKRRKKEEIRK